MNQLSLFETAPPPVQNARRPPANRTETSQAAAEQIAPHTATMRARVFAYISNCPGGATRNEIAMGLKMKLQTVCGRCNELLHQRLVYQSDEARGGGKVLRTRG